MAVEDTCWAQLLGAGTFVFRRGLGGEFFKLVSFYFSCKASAALLGGRDSCVGPNVEGLGKQSAAVRILAWITSWLLTQLFKKMCAGSC